MTSAADLCPALDTPQALTDLDVVDRINPVFWTDDGKPNSCAANPPAQR
jgi:hypothetical protein